MSKLDLLAEVIASELSLRPDQITRHKTFLAMTETDLGLLHSVHERINSRQFSFSDSLSEHLLAFPVLQTILANGATASAAKSSTGSLNANSAKEPRIGAARQRTGLEPKRLTGTCQQCLSELRPMLWKLLQDTPQSFLPTYDAIIKMISIDMELGLNAGSRADHEQMPQHNNYAEQIIDSMPSGLLVVDAQYNIRSLNPAAKEILALGDDAVEPDTPLSAVIEDQHLFDSMGNALSNENQLCKIIVPRRDGRGTRYLEFELSCAHLNGETLLLLMIQDVTARIQSEDELRQFRSGMNSIADAIYVIDRARMRLVDVNDTAISTLGYSREELLALELNDLKPDPAEVARTIKLYDDIICSDSKTATMRTVHVRKDGTHFPVEVHYRAVETEGKYFLIAVATDITPKLRTEEKLRESEERFRVTFNQAGVGLAHVVPDGRWLRVNQKLCDILGYSQKELLNMTFQENTHPDDLQSNLEYARRILAGEIQNYNLEKRYLHKDGSSIWIHLSVSLLRNEEGEPKYFISVMEDISRRKNAEGALLHLANYDALTGLPNRTLMQDRLAQSLVYAQRAGTQVAVIALDLDNFNNINDSLGSAIGDLILTQIGQKLLTNMRHGDTAARLGGDDFVVILSDLTGEESVELATQRILHLIAEPITITDNEIYCTCSLGISLYPRDGQDSAALMKNAQSAMYLAREAGGNNIQFYAHEMNARTLERLKLENGLRRALERQEFVLHYQPQIDIRSGHLIGMEALVRWQPPGQAMISPAEFIPLAEKTGLILPIGEWVLRTACLQNKAWQDAGLPAVPIAVNLSPRQFKQQDIVKMVSLLAQEDHCDLTTLELEITESVAMEHPEVAIETMKKLRAMGIHLSIDDFGTGYSSLNYLKRFPINTLKIDQSFVRDITTDSDDAAIVTAIIALAHSMKLKVIAEGVETAEQLAFLREHQCDQIQGYYFSRPLPANRMEQLFRESIVQ